MSFLIFGMTVAWPEKEITLIPLIMIASGSVGLLTMIKQSRFFRMFIPATIGFLMGWGLIHLFGIGLALQFQLPKSLIKVPLLLEGTVVDQQKRDDKQHQWTLTDARLVDEALDIPGLLRLSLYRYAKKNRPLTIWPEVLPGDRVRLIVKLRPLEKIRVPGIFDITRYWRLRGITISGYSSKVPVNLGQVEPAYGNRLRAKISRWIETTLPISQQGLTEAILIGKRGKLTLKQKDSLAAAGLFHLIAISGAHLGLVAAVVFMIVRWILVRLSLFSVRLDMRRITAAITLLAILFYAVLAGWSPATQRAFVMAALFFIAIVFWRTTMIWYTFAMTVGILLLLWPFYLLESGFQFSVIAVTVILVFMPVLESLTKKIPLFASEAHQNSKKARLIKSLLLLFGSSLLIGLILTPFQAFYFHAISPYSALANLIAIPWMGMVIMPLGLLALLGYALFPAMGVLLLKATGWCLMQLELWAIWITDLPGAMVRVIGPSEIGLVLFSLCMIGAMTIQSWPKRLGFALLAMVAALWPKGDLLKPHQAMITALDVGQAQAVVVRDLNQQWSLIDVGGYTTPFFDVGESIISSFLWHHNVKQIKNLIISHPQRDHMAGVARIMKNFKVESLWIGPWTQEETAKTTIQEILRTAKRSHVKIRSIHRGFKKRDPGAFWRILSPKKQSLQFSANSRSLVVELTLNKQRFLFPGDIGRIEELDLVTQKLLQSHYDLLLAPHHGSRYSSSQPFIDYIKADHVIFSAGKYNRYGFPKPDVLKRWQSAGTKIWRTDQQGTVTVLLDGTQMRIERF
ncbi:DNA internalization-related competence protein ComEC/Rec2 [Magnetococcales bacterium HHB-1]